MKADDFPSYDSAALSFEFYPLAYTKLYTYNLSTIEKILYTNFPFILLFQVCITNLHFSSPNQIQPSTSFK